MDAYRHVVVVKLVDEGRWTSEGSRYQGRRSSQDALDARSGFALPRPRWHLIKRQWRHALQRSTELGRLRSKVTTLLKSA